jgi:hypothetical protein
MAKITLATVKKFIRQNRNNLFIKQKSRFDGMYDCVMDNKNAEFRQVAPESIDFEKSNTFGIPGAWFVGSSRDYFNEYSDDNYIGYTVYNCCGQCVIVTQVK